MKLTQIIVAALLSSAAAAASNNAHKEVESNRQVERVLRGGRRGGRGGQRGGQRGGRGRGRDVDDATKAERCECYLLDADADQDACIQEKIEELCEAITDTDADQSQCIARKNCTAGDTDQNAACVARRMDRMARRKTKCEEDAAADADDNAGGL